MTDSQITQEILRYIDTRLEGDNYPHENSRRISVLLSRM